MKLGLKTDQKPVAVHLQLGISCSNQRTDRAPIRLTKSSKLASELLAATGLVCLRTGALAGHPGHSRVTIGGISDRDSKGLRIWFHSTKAAEKVIAELHRTHGMHRGSGVVIEAIPDETDRMLRASARLIGIAVMGDEFIDAKMASLIKRAEAAIKAMPRRQRALKRLRNVTDFDLTGLLARQSM
jgi:hypothetical protein